MRLYLFKVEVALKVELARCEGRPCLLPCLRQLACCLWCELLALGAEANPMAPPLACRAGDGYAAGLLYGFLRGFDISSMGRVGARVASAVIAHMGSALSPAQAAALVEGLPPGADRKALRSFDAQLDAM